MDIERISEAELYPKIKRLVEDYGELTTRELKELLIPILEGEGLAEEDQQILTNRNDRRIDQKIRNVGAHAAQGAITYKPGFAIDKTGEDVIFRPLETQESIPSPEKTEQIKELSRRYRSRKIDYARKSERDQFVGLAGEELVVRYEQNRLNKVLQDFDPSVDVIHLSQVEGDGAGYDILSKNEDGTARRIEVKTTTGNVGTAFYMTENEKTFMEEYQHESTFLYRVYNFNKETMLGDIKIITATELLSDYVFDSITYKVTPKTRV
jgi:hypothetical protein